MKKIPKRIQALERLLREINWSITIKGREILKKFNSSKSQLQCLSTLYFFNSSNDKQEMTMGELAKSTDMSFSAMTGLVDRLIKNKLIRRRRSNTDRRKVIIDLSKRGTSLIKEIINERQSYLHFLSKKLKVSELSSTLETLKQLSIEIKKG
ncbi:MarR family transcriptional regulator [Candidatus Dependentiae bacterium]|nr:MarR family transcriptional regulator [Candidatus Dependentiae bacterium]